MFGKVALDQCSSLTWSSWFRGLSFYKLIKTWQDNLRSHMPIRINLSQGVSVSGRVVQGRVRAGDKVVVMPLEDPATAARLERNGASAKAARAGDNAEVGGSRRLVWSASRLACFWFPLPSRPPGTEKEEQHHGDGRVTGRDCALCRFLRFFRKIGSGSGGTELLCVWFARPPAASFFLLKDASSWCTGSSHGIVASVAGRGPRSKTTE